MNYLRIVALLALTPLIGCAGGGTQSAAPSVARPTIALKKVSYFKDGGTTGIVLQDSEGKETRLCFDGRLKSKTPCRIYANAIHPEEPNAELVASGSRREGELIGILQSHLDSRYSNSKQAELLANGSWKLPEPEVHAWRILRAIEGWKRAAGEKGKDN